MPNRARSGEVSRPARVVAPDERELLEPDLHRPRAGALADHHVELVVLHRGIEDLLDRRRHPVNLVDEQHFVRLQIGEHPGQVARLLDDRPGGRLDGHAHLGADHVGQRGLAEPGRSVEQHVIEGLAPASRRRNRYLQVVADAVLPDVLGERPRPQPCFVLRLLVAGHAGHHAIDHECGVLRPSYRLRISSRSAALSATSKVGSPPAASAASTAFSAKGR
jgi:hypothetical protein